MSSDDKDAFREQVRDHLCDFMVAARRPGGLLHADTKLLDRYADAIVALFESSDRKDAVFLMLREQAIDAILEAGSPLSRAEIIVKVDEFLADAARALNESSDREDAGGQGNS